MPCSLTPDQRTLRARVAAHALHAQGGTNTRAANEALQRRFEREVDPDGVLPADELARRAGHAKKRYYAALALKSSVARRKARDQRAAAADAPGSELADATQTGEPGASSAG